MYSLALIIFVVSEKKAFEHFPPSIRKCLFINWLIIFKQTIFSRHRIQSLNLISYKYNIIQKNVKFLFTNKQNSRAFETFWIKWMYQLEEISRPQLYPRACICLMMYFKNNWNAGPFFLLHGFFRRKKTSIYIYIY